MNIPKRLKEEIDWDRFVVGFVFGYAVSMIPLLLGVIDDLVVPRQGQAIPVHLESDSYIILSVLSLASIGTALTNRGKRGVVEFVIVGVCLIFGLLMYHFSNILEVIERRSTEELMSMGAYMEQFFFVSLALSLAFFAAANLGSREVRNG